MHTETEHKRRPVRPDEWRLIWSGLLMVEQAQREAQRETLDEAKRLRAAGLDTEAANWQAVAADFERSAQSARMLLDCLNAEALTGVVDVTTWAEWVAEVES